ncbi:MAG TPA: phosphoribosylanthranilate isomerase [Candidatus Dormibacteraeota bacterium]|nr:phosphoribosylanthranilate isomerase [Candidatus Dormibacteraeota bacterium]
MTLVKVCGVCDAAAARAVADAGADLVGFHFCSSLRRVRPEEVRAMVEALDRRPRLVGVFIDQPEEEVDQVAEFVGLDLVQLHGSEPPGFRCRRPIVKALKVRGGAVPDTDDWPDPILLDSWSPDQRGGTGRTWDWETARALAARRRVIFAGGLHPGNVGAVVRTFQPHGVDVSSGVERAVRSKDADLVLRFVQAVRDMDAAVERSGAR